jgi:hypothetical protein
VRSLRRALGVLSIVWLIAQMTTLATAPAALWLAGDDSCQCADGAGAMCPMHHPATTGHAVCAMRGGAPVADAVLNWLLGTGGCLVTGPSVPIDRSIVAAKQSTASTLASRFVLPDSPPPRA